MDVADYILAVRNNDPEALERALVAFVKQPHSDFRDSLFTLCSIYNCAKRLQMDTDAVFRKAAEHGNEEVRDFILRYLKHGSKNLLDFGLDDVDGPEGYEIYVNDGWTRKQMEKYKKK